jgi:uncharacterized protein YhbP (UPF0306 family)
MTPRCEKGSPKEEIMMAIKAWIRKHPVLTYCLVSSAAMWVVVAVVAVARQGAPLAETT